MTCLSTDAGEVIDKYLNPIAEPARLASCPPLIREWGQATRRARHVVIDEGGRRERMPIGVIVSSYFLRAGGVAPSAILDLLYRDGTSTIPRASSGRRS